ncbi:MAG: acyltransferase family protein [Flavobacteriales bacterium]
MSKPTQVNMIVALRAIAALMVCFFHFVSHDNELGYLFSPDDTIRQVGYYGHHGVNVFFVISGFVIPLSMYYGKYRIQNFLQFMGKRLVRLHPPFVMSMMLYAIMEVIYWSRGGYDIVYDMVRIAHNFFLTARIFDYDWFQDVYWTLAIELQYYVLIALLLPLLLSPRRWLQLLTLSVLIFISMFFDEAYKHLFFYHTPVFALGIVLFMQHIGKLSSFDSILMSLLCLVVCYYEINVECMLFVAGTALCIYAVHWRNRFLEWVGNISYSLYLTHAFSGCQLLYYFAPKAVSYRDKFILLVSAFIVSLVFAYLFHLLIEKPSMRWSQYIRFKK